jgi:hypothetical protein
MTQAAADGLTLVELIELTGPFEEFSALLAALMERLEREGVPGLASMQFYRERPDSNLIGAVISFRDADQLLTHQNMIATWPEFARLARIMKLVDMRVHGKLNAQAEAWIRQFNGPLRKFEQHVGGFVRG